jgi:hypothetical protein
LAGCRRPVPRSRQRHRQGHGNGTLSGRKLTISGTFEGLAAPATIARLHQGVAKGARGAAITDLTVNKGASGTLTGSVDLTAPASRSAPARQALYPAS